MEDGTNGRDFTPHGRAAAPAGGVGLLGLLGRQGSGGFLPLWGGPPARFGDFPTVESHAGGWGRSAPGKPASAAYIETHRQAQHELDGTFDRANLPKARWGVSKRPAAAAVPESQRGLSVRTHSLNPTFSFRPAEKRTCR